MNALNSRPLACACLALCLLLSACGGSASHDASALAPVSNRQAQPVALRTRLTGLPAPSAIKRGSEVVPNYHRFGDQYDTNNGPHNVLLTGEGGAIFNPEYVAGGSTEPLSWAIYSFNATDYTRDESFRYELTQPLPAGSAVYLGLANTSTLVWDWYVLDGSGRLDVPFVAHQDALKNMLVAVVAIGTNPVTLQELKLGPTGSWSHSLGSARNEDSIYMWVHQPDNQVYCAGSSVDFDTTDYQGFVASLDEDGKLLWARRLQLAGARLYPVQYNISPAGNVVGVCNYFIPDTGSGSQDGYVVFMLDTQGQLLWSQDLPLPDSGSLHGISASATRVYVTGDYEAQPSDNDLLLFSFDSSNGSLVNSISIDSGQTDSPGDPVYDPVSGKTYSTDYHYGSFPDPPAIDRFEINEDGSIGTASGGDTGYAYGPGSLGAGSDEPTPLNDDPALGFDAGAVSLKTDGTVNWATQIDIGLKDQPWFCRYRADGTFFMTGRTTTLEEAAFVSTFDNAGTYIGSLGWVNNYDSECYALDFDSYGSLYCVLTGAINNSGQWTLLQAQSKAFAPSPDYSQTFTLSSAAYLQELNVTDLSSVDALPEMVLDTGGGLDDVLVEKLDVLDPLMNTLQ